MVGRNGSVILGAVLAALTPSLVPETVMAQAGGQPPAQAAQPAPTYPPVRDSWLSDRRSIGVGQIITILIDEQTVASADKEVSSVRDRNRDLSVAAGSGGSMSGGGLRTNNDVSDRQRGESSRRERFAAEISARVTELGPNGLLRVEGAKKVQIDEHEQEVIVRGWVRASDVSIQNTIQSWRIADAEILYDSNDELGKSGGFWSKLLDLIIP